MDELRERVAEPRVPLPARDRPAAADRPRRALLEPPVDDRLLGREEPTSSSRAALTPASVPFTTALPAFAAAVRANFAAVPKVEAAFLPRVAALFACARARFAAGLATRVAARVLVRATRPVRVAVPVRLEPDRVEPDRVEPDRVVPDRVLVRLPVAMMLPP